MSTWHARTGTYTHTLGAGTPDTGLQCRIQPTTLHHTGQRTWRFCKLFFLF